MPDQIARDFAARQIALETASLARDARHLADAVAKGETDHGGDAGRIAQTAMQVAQQAARLAAIRETVSYLTTQEH
jgi:hypothetical protein